MVQRVELWEEFQDDLFHAYHVDILSLSASSVILEYEGTSLVYFLGQLSIQVLIFALIRLRPGLD